MRPILHSALASSCVLLFGGTAAAQSMISARDADVVIEDETRGGPLCHARLGHALQVVPDLDGDERNDLAVSAVAYVSERSGGGEKCDTWHCAGFVEPRAFISAYSLQAQSASRLFKIWDDGEQPRHHRTGFSLSLGDLNGDAFPDLLVGAPTFDAPTTEVVGAIRGYDLRQPEPRLFHFAPSSYRHCDGADQYLVPEGMGSSVAVLGDLGGLVGRAIAVVSPGYQSATETCFDPLNFGRLTILRQGSLAMINQVEGLPLGESLIGPVVPLTDVSGDGITDLAVVYAAPFGAGYTQSIRVYSGATLGQAAPVELATLQDPASSGLAFELSSSEGRNTITEVGDVNADGVLDFAVALRGPSDVGAVIYSGDGFTELGRLAFNRSGQPVFGPRTVGAVGDANGDGVPDILVGLPGTRFEPGSGAAYLFSGATHRVLRVFTGVTCEEDNPGPSCCTIAPLFGTSVTGGDLDGDGLSDVVVGAPDYDAYPDSQEGETGRVYVFYSEPIVECLADYNFDGVVNSQDHFDFLVKFFSSDPAADFNRDGLVNSQDFFDFLTAFFGGCSS